ncbi:Bcr/CflA family efflux MFS transporter [Leucobacter sp. Z1108]|uniref:Bcr/CflA family efflux MFS transporter n=1 Tax=Leucobacter sp. Z1108 TaxID=3439066 RepID=UPI003F38AC82
MSPKRLSAPSAPAMNAALPGGMIAAVLALTLMGPFTSDGMLPALPALAAEFGAGADRVQLTITAATFGVAIGQLLLGTLSDALGRRGLLLAGGVGMVLASVLGAVSTSLPVLILACGLLGLTSAAGLALGRAVLSDRLSRGPLTRAYSLWGAVVGVAPIVAAVGGAQLLTFTGWRSIFWAFALLALVTLALTLFGLPETLPPERRAATSVRSFVGSLAAVIRSRLFVASSLIAGLGFASVFAYVSASPFILQTMLGFSPAMFSLVLAADGVGLMIASAIAAKLALRVEPTRLISIGLTIASLGALVALYAVAADAVNAFTMIASMLLVGGSMGFVFGAATSLALLELGHLAGTALAVMGALQFVFAGIAAPLVGVAGDRSAGPYAFVVTATVVGSWIALAYAARSLNGRWHASAGAGVAAAAEREG